MQGVLARFTRDGRSDRTMRCRPMLVAVGTLAGSSGVGAARSVPFGPERPSVPLEIQLALSVGLLVFVGISMLALFQSYSYETLDAIDANAPVALALGIAVHVCFLIGAFAVGLASVIPFLGLLTLPVFVVLLVFYLAWGVLGIVSVGTFLSGRVTDSNAWLGLLVGAVLVSVLQLIPFGFVPLFLVVSLGMGGVARRRMGASTSERSVPSGRF